MKIKKNYREKVNLFVSVVALGLIFFSSQEKLQAQAEVSSGTLFAVIAKDLPDKKISLELTPLEGNHVNPEKCEETDAQSIYLQPGQKLVVTLNKKWLFYRQDGKAHFGTNYDIQSDLIIRNWNSWKYWMAGSAPVTESNFEENDFFNNYFYQAANHGGEAALSFISVTYPRYYSSLHIFINEVCK